LRSLGRKKEGRGGKKGRDHVNGARRLSFDSERLFPLSKGPGDLRSKKKERRKGREEKRRRGVAIRRGICAWALFGNLNPQTIVREGALRIRGEEKKREYPLCNGPHKTLRGIYCRIRRLSGKKAVAFSAKGGKRGKKRGKRERPRRRGLRIASRFSTEPTCRAYSVILSRDYQLNRAQKTS